MSDTSRLRQSRAMIATIARGSHSVNRCSITENTCTRVALGPVGVYSAASNPALQTIAHTQIIVLTLSWPK